MKKFFTKNRSWTSADSFFLLNTGEHSVRDGGDCAEQKSDVEKTILHPGYNDATSQNDIAILKLKTSLQFNKYVQPACLAKSFSYQV